MRPIPTARFVRAVRACARASLLILGSLTVVAPYALANPPAAPGGVCLEGAPECGRTEVLSTTPRYKWHPGHYQTTATIGQSGIPYVSELANEPYVRGVQQRYWWAQLEPKRGVYDFSRIEQHLALLKPMGKRLVIQVMDRSWSGTSATGVLPAYLGSDPVFKGGWYVKPNNQGVVARLWEPAVMDRVIALYAALGARFDKEVYVEAIMTEETTPDVSPGPPAPASYTRATLATQIKRLVTATRKAWPTTNVLVPTNYLSGELQGIIAHCATQKVGVGGSDVMPPPHSPTEGDRIIRGEIGGVDYRGKLPIGYGVQSPSLCGKEGCWLPSQLYDYSYSTLKATHVFWVRLGTERDTSTAKYSWKYGILPTIRARQGRSVTACPTSYAGACATN
jgi:hypothetical protein